MFWSSQVNFIYIALYTTEIVLKQLLNINVTESVAAFPLPFKLHKLKIRPISQKLPKLFIFTWGGFSGNLKKEYVTRQTAMETVFFAFTGHLVYVKVTWSFFKGDPLCPFLQYVITSQIIYYIIIRRFMHVSLNANELLLPAPFSRIGLCLYSSFLRYSAKKKKNICLVFMAFYIYAFKRHFYPKRLTVHSGYTCIVSMCVPWELNPQPLRS